MLQVEIVHVLGGEDWVAVFVGRGEHGGHQPTDARPGYHVEVYTAAFVA
jgi:hypothetical protein